MAPVETAASAEVGVAIAHIRALARGGWIGEAYHLLRDVVQAGHLVDDALYQDICVAYRSRDVTASVLAPHQPVGCLEDDVLLTSLHFAAGLTAEQKKVVFKSAVRKIDVETSTQCNRRCSYCSNSLHDRRSTNRYMADDIYRRLVTELAEIGYTGQLAFVGHNEPLMHMDDLVPRIALARRHLPHARIAVFSNGDYLTRDVLDRLEESGVDSLLVTMHTAPGKPYEECTALLRALELARNLGLKPVIEEMLLRIKTVISLSGSKIAISIRHADMGTVGHNQGGGIPGAGLQISGRKQPCAESLFGFILGYTGNVHPCSLVVADIPQHAHCVMGNLAAQSIFDIYAGEKFIAWRKSLLVDGPKPEPCTACPSHTCSTPPNWSEMVHGAMALAEAIATKENMRRSA